MNFHQKASPKEDSQILSFFSDFPPLFPVCNTINPITQAVMTSEKDALRRAADLSFVHTVSVKASDFRSEHFEAGRTFDRIDFATCVSRRPKNR